MEILIIVLLLIAAAAFAWNKLRPGAGDAGEAAAPAAKNARELESRVAEFMEKDQFTLVFQPVVDFRTGSTCCGEILSRLNHPERGVIFPDEFLPAINAAGLHSEFDRYIFRKTCAWLSRSLEEGASVDTVSCNFSRKTLSEVGTASALAGIADRYGLDHHRLAIEITERERESDAGELIRNLTQLKAAGFRIFLDDYGCGVTSVKDLMQYPLDVLKIDRSLLLAAETEQGKAAYRGLVAMAAELGAEVACEGIETEQQSRFAREAGCDYGQGFLYYRPMSTEQVFEMMEKSSILHEEN